MSTKRTKQQAKVAPLSREKYLSMVDTLPAQRQVIHLATWLRGLAEIASKRHAPS